MIECVGPAKFRPDLRTAYERYCELHERFLSLENDATDEERTALYVEYLWFGSTLSEMLQQPS